MRYSPDRSSVLQGLWSPVHYHKQPLLQTNSTTTASAITIMAQHRHIQQQVPHVFICIFFVPYRISLQSVKKTWASHPWTLRNPLASWTLAADRTWTSLVYQKLGRADALKEFVCDLVSLKLDNKRLPSDLRCEQKYCLPAQTSPFFHSGTNVNSAPPTIRSLSHQMKMRQTHIANARAK